MRRQQAPPDGNPAPPESASRCEVRKAKAVSGAKCSPDRAPTALSAAPRKFTGRVQRMARVHQYGLKDRPNRRQPGCAARGAPVARFHPATMSMIEDIIIRHPANKILR
ncbi:phage virion morphogenesis protein [Salmonella enterica subsp. enterica]|nr:phage virion morphogenesis protein [Salmonella enterica subsp. enterica]